jgi:hypothetical protein
MIKAFGIFKVVLSIALLTSVPFVFLIVLAPPPTVETNNSRFIFLLLLPYACYLFYSGQTQLMKLELKKPAVIGAGGIFGTIVSMAVVTNYLNLFSFLLFFLILTISFQDLFRVKKQQPLSV